RIVAAGRCDGARHHRGGVRTVRTVYRQRQCHPLPGRGRDMGCRLLRRPAPCTRCLGDHARCAVDVAGRVDPRPARHLDELRRTARGRCTMNRPMKRLIPGAALVAALALAACSNEAPQLDQYGADPELPRPDRTLMPDMVIAEPAAWGDRTPTVPQGYAIAAIATDLKIPRQTLVLPNGDILVAEGRGGNAPKLKPKDVIAGKIKAQGNTSVESGNRLTLLRDADGD